MMVFALGWKPLPPGHTRLYSSDPISGHFSHRSPQATPTEQQHADLETSSPKEPPQTLYPRDYSDVLRYRDVYFVKKTNDAFD